MFIKLLGASDVNSVHGLFLNGFKIEVELKLHSVVLCLRQLIRFSRAKNRIGNPYFFDVYNIVLFLESQPTF